MPELPEVETYVRELEPELRNRTVVGAVVFWPRTIAAPAPEEFVARICGQGFARFDRRGKYMLFGLTGADTLIVHLRMTGKFHLHSAATPPDSHTHVLLDLDDGRQLHFRDPRKFGRIWLTAEPESILRKLGPEPASAEFSPEQFAGRLAGRSAPIKALLLDQTIVAGVGNIYADEALYLAGIHPRLPAGRLTTVQITRLHDAIRTVLSHAIDLKGSSLGDSWMQNYIRPGGSTGGFQEEHQVFRRTGQPCPRCGAQIERIVIAQRSTHFCPSCQPE